MIFKCPGQDIRNLKNEFLRCAKCGKEVELFTDELKRRCPYCKTYVYRDTHASCWMWCKSAKECLGDDRLNNLQGGK